MADGKKDNSGWLWLALILIIIGIGYYANKNSGGRMSGQHETEPPSPANRVIRDGSTGVFDAMTVAVSQGDLDRALQLTNAGDQAGIDRMFGEGRLLSVAAGTRGRVIDTGFFSHEIKIESGPHAGTYVFVPAAGDGGFIVDP